MLGVLCYPNEKKSFITITWYHSVIEILLDYN